MWDRVVEWLPASVKRALRLAYVAVRVTSDRQSLRTYARLADDRGEEPGDSARQLRIRALGGHPVLVRPGTSDLSIVWTTFARRYHLPPPEIGAPGIIWDLGANIGLTMAHFACLFPQARVLGIELDEHNVSMARQNVAAWSDRCEVIHAAVWPGDGEVRYLGWGGTSHFQVRDAPEGTPVRALSLATLLRERRESVDYLKVDIEGAERAVLQDGSTWAQNVRCVKVELHGDYGVEDCEADLRRLGYRTLPDLAHVTSVIGIRAA
jgi:FkbM family methyltransferase